MNLKKCPEHGYTLESQCKTCNKPTQEAHYKFLKLRDVKEKKEKPTKTNSSD